MIELDIDPKKNNKLRTPNRKAVVVRLDDGLLRLVKHAAIERDSTYTEVFVEALTMWLKQNEAENKAKRSKKQ